MALNYDISKVKNYKNRCYHQRDDGLYLEPKTEHAVFMTMHIGMGEITEKNYQEFHRRLAMWSEILDGKPCFLSIEDVQNLIGLETNSNSMSRPSFNARIMRIKEREMDAQARIRQQEASTDAKV